MATASGCTGCRCRRCRAPWEGSADRRTGRPPAACGRAEGSHPRYSFQCRIETAKPNGSQPFYSPCCDSGEVMAPPSNLLVFETGTPGGLFIPATAPSAPANIAAPRRRRNSLGPNAGRAARRLLGLDALAGPLVGFLADEVERDGLAGRGCAIAAHFLKLGLNLVGDGGEVRLAGAHSIEPGLVLAVGLFKSQLVERT